MTVKPWEVLYLHAPSDGRPCHVVFSGTIGRMRPVTNADGLFRIGFVDVPDPTDWTGPDGIQWAWAREADLVARP